MGLLPAVMISTSSVMVDKICATSKGCRMYGIGQYMRMKRNVDAINKKVKNLT